MTGVKPGATPDPFKPEVPADPIRRQMHELERGLTIRIEELARENRRLRRLWMGTVVTGALLLGLATALVVVSARHGLPGTVADVIEARQFLVRDGNGDYHALNDRCTHADVSLSEGEVNGCTLECWLHGSRFDVRTGDPSGPPATIPVAVYPVKIDGDDVFVSVTSDLN